MPKERTMFGPDGILIGLRRAITLQVENQAVAFARLVVLEDVVSYRGYCDFIGRILLEDKFPQGRKYFAQLKKEREKKAKRGSKPKDVMDRQTRYVKLAVAAVRLETNNAAFEKAFSALHQFVEQNVNFLHEPVSYDNMNDHIDGYICKKIQTTPGHYDMQCEGFGPVLWTTYRNYENDVVQLGPQPEETDDTTFPVDHVLRNTFISMDTTNPKQENLPSVEDSYVGYETLREHIERWKENKKLKFDPQIFKKRKKDEVENLFQYLYPKSTDAKFKEHMMSYLSKYGMTHYVGSRNCREGVIEHLRRMARFLLIKPSTVQIEDKVYALRYLSFDKKSWKVQLLAPEGSTGICHEWKHLCKKYVIFYPGESMEISSVNVDHLRQGEHDTEYNFDVLKTFVHTESVKGKEYNYRCEEDIGKKIRFSAKALLQDNVALPFLQLLVYRYHQDLRTTLNSIVLVEGNDGNKMLYSVDNTKTKTTLPNRKHPDIWHQLLYYSKQRQRKRGDKMMNLGTSYVSNVIDNLQQYLSEEGGHEKPFFQWLKRHYPADVEEKGLWHKIMLTLSKNKRPDNISDYSGNNYIDDAFARRTV